MTKSNSSVTPSTSNLYEHPWFNQLKLLDNTMTCESPSPQKPKSETPGQRYIKEIQTEGTKVCAHCNQEKPLDDFHAHLTKPDGRDHRCKECKNSSNRVINRIRKAAPPKSDSCDCCGKTDVKLLLDHCHDTHQFRGWLCKACNSGIGQLGDNLDGLFQAVTYLQTHGNEIQNSTGTGELPISC